MNHLKSHSLLTNAMFLTLAGILCRIIGFFFRIYLSRTFGAENIGIYQLLAPIIALVYSLAVYGFQTAISKLVAAEQALKHDSSFFLLSIGCLCSLSISCILSYLVYQHAAFLAIHFLLEPRTASLLKILCLSFPLSAIHSCINGYFYGIKNAAFPSICQCMEQCVRVSSVYLLIIYMHNATTTPSISYAVIGMIMGEAASCLLSLTYLLFSRSKNTPPSIENSPRYCALVGNLFLLAIPLSTSRVIQNALQSMEAVALPSMLQKYGLDTATALSHYGVLTGMTLPLVLFPTAVTGSIAVILMPEISQAQALGNKGRIENAFRKSVHICFIMGFLFTGILFLFSTPISLYVFKEPLCAGYIRTICFMCPFMYCNSTLSSIMHGLGKTISSFIFTVFTLSIRLALTYLCVPHFGMQGYLLIMLISQILLFIMQMCILQKTLRRT